jgi:23S rRNA (guanine745-N1)-methyltransferase
MWICPACQQVLEKNAQSLVCPSGHSYDLGKEGYVNLLLANQKRSKEPGDNKAMVNARRAFLEQGYYQPLADKLIELAREQLLQQTTELNLFDAGCGEGYYLNQLAKGLTGRTRNIAAYGSDISKIAVQKAAKKYPFCQFSVASCFNIPLSEESQDGVLQVFAPSSSEEVRRILKSGGFWMQVNPAAGHLRQLKQAIYDKPEEHKVHSELPAGFSLQVDQTLSFDMKLTDEASRLNLLMMTPYYWTATQEKIISLVANMDRLTADFHIRVLQKNVPEACVG